MMRTNQVKSWKQATNQPTPNTKQVIIKVKRKNLITKGEKVLWSIIGLMFVIASFYIVSFSSTMDTLNRDVQTLNQQVIDKTVTNEDLVIEIKELSKPERITKIAKSNGLKIQDTEVKKANPLNN